MDRKCLTNYIVADTATAPFNVNGIDVGVPESVTMTEKSHAGELELSDSELVTVLKNHGMNRRVLMKVFGAGAVASALGGTAAGKPSGGANIDDIYGATYYLGETLPSGLVDHTVDLHTHPGDATFEGFPAPDGDDEDDQDDVPEFIFNPVGLHVEPGDVVEFKVHDPVTHTATAFHPHYEHLEKRVPNAKPYTSPPITGSQAGPGDSWLYRFSTKGIHDIACLPHFNFGMVMRIVVFDPKKDSLDESCFEEYDPIGPHPIFDVTNANKVLGDPELDPENIVAEGEIAWDELTLP